jgi:hypothetical protein
VPGREVSSLARSDAVLVPTVEAYRGPTSRVLGSAARSPPTCFVRMAQAVLFSWIWA